MVWQAKLELSDLLRRRKLTPEQWVKNNKFTTLDEVRSWCNTNKAVLDENMFKFLKKPASGAPKVQKAEETLPPHLREDKAPTKKAKKKQAPVDVKEEAKNSGAPIENKKEGDA